ncbi:helix-turn-helix transcriptional regulator [Candidatus Woesebacteria bacterium]|nr:helix-turn-helix transcriptional regulator [Candidatus Woesebacteria bacterium]
MKNTQTITWSSVQKNLNNDPAYLKAVKETSLEYIVAREIIKARLKRKLTQKALAQAMDTQQSVISRVENARTVPSLSFLKRMADVFGSTLHVEFRVK